ncbi:dna repair rad57 [Pyrenophora seminiperda CCB06]|uniref:Dna repair rad57 n=1 Tax=Pyrenophora seminiperda CCB06 TaxID=1302712 RepID=A0A3M7MEA1_9PLEO|nr:dna repair rad57 [Pyrenophora seminiperda CCB06]
MTDLLQMLPDFDQSPYTHLVPSLDKALITTNDLLTLDAGEVARRAQVPAGEVRKLADGVVGALLRDVGVGEFLAPSSKKDDEKEKEKDAWRCISTLDEGLDAALAGGIPRGYLVEITGESGAGKSQLLLTLLLSAQLAPPTGLAQSTVYISTEAPLSTKRLSQLLASHPRLASLPAAQKPSLSRILSIQTPDLESQDHILRYQLPVAIRKHNVGLVVIDSVAANYRAEFEKKGGGGEKAAAAMARRGTQLVQLGALLREIARKEGVAVVVANQVADRFARAAPPPSSSNLASRSTSTNSQPPPPPSQGNNANGNSNANNTTSLPSPHLALALALSPDPLSLDHQQRWFTGWGDSPYEQLHVQKTPSLGLVWTNQLACRIALKKQPVLQSSRSRPLVRTAANANGKDEWNEQDEGESNETHIVKWRRWFKVVFAAWAAAEGEGEEGEAGGGGGGGGSRGVEFLIGGEGVRSVSLF